MNMKNTSLKLSTIALAIALASCGGGGGYFGEASTGTGGTGTGTGTGGTTGQPLNSTKIQIIDVNGLPTQTITSAGATVKIVVTNESGARVSGALVTFTSTGGITFGTTNGAVITNAEGEASISVKPTNSTSSGAFQISATISFDGETASVSATNFSLQAANVQLSNVQAGKTALNSGESTNITLKTVDSNNPTIGQNDITVNFTATCGTFEPASVVSSNQGDVTTTYKSVSASGGLCSGSQQITVRSSDGSASQLINLTIASAQANSIIYSTSGDVKLATRNSGSASTGQIEFTVFSGTVPAANQDVIVDLTNSPSDFSFVTSGNRQSQTVRSDSNGKVLVNLFPGNLPGPVEVKATLVSNNNVFVLARNVSVATGRAYQGGMSLSASKNALNGDNDGDTSTVTVRLNDRLGNPVPNGTVVSFVAEGGSITPNCSTANNSGTCTVTLSTQNPRPADDRVTVLAFLEGDKSYIDQDSDQVYTSGVDSLISNIGDLYRDDNENNQFDTGEFKFTRGASGATCANSTIAEPNIANTCNNELSAVLRKQFLFAFSSPTPTLVEDSGLDVNTIVTPTFNFRLFGNSALTVPLPSGTTVTLTSKDNTANNQLSCTVELLSGLATVPGVMSLATPATFQNSGVPSYRARVVDCANGDSVKITTVLGSSTTVYTYDVQFPTR